MRSEPDGLLGLAGHRVAGAPVVRQLLAGAGEDAVLRDLVGPPTVAEVVDEGVGVVRR